MIVKSAAGPVDLSKPENVRRGMVFHGDTRDITAGKEVGPDFWESTDGVLFHPSRGWSLIGCDPAVATRADCERFGIAPLPPGVTATAHGFARTRDGFAVDLTDPDRLCAGMVFEVKAALYGESVGKRFVLVGRIMEDGNGGESWVCHGDAGGDWRVWKAVRKGEVRFIGLDARHARAEDVERMCCGAEDPSNFVPGQTRCTLAIGDHAEHEDIAAGVKWTAGMRQDRFNKATNAMFDRADAWARKGIVAEMRIAGLRAKEASGERPEPDDALRARIRQQQREDSLIRKMIGIPEPGTPKEPSQPPFVWTDGSAIDGVEGGAWTTQWVTPPPRPDAPTATEVRDGVLRTIKCGDNRVGITVNVLARHPIDLTPQAKALRAALPSIDALPWSAADKRALRDAAHAVCEMVEATDGKAPAGLRGSVTEMLAALATAAHIGPAVLKEAESARGAAAAAMPKRK